jgi:hypothetical protein
MAVRQETRQPAEPPATRSLTCTCCPPNRSNGVVLAWCWPVQNVEPIKRDHRRRHVFACRYKTRPGTRRLDKAIGEYTRVSTSFMVSCELEPEVEGWLDSVGFNEMY